jgi:predicted GH43/DUF377 family glycosyl hydrolase
VILRRSDLKVKSRRNDILALAAGLGVVVLLSHSGTVGRASLVVEEEFNYGSSTNNLAGLGGATGFAAPWSNDAGMGTFSYVPIGLTFGSLATVAGAAQVGSVSNVAPYLKAQASRPFNLGTNLTGTLFGSYLFSIPYFGSGNDSLAVLFGNVNTTTAGLGGSPDNYAQLDVSGLYYNGGSKGNVRLAGTGGSVSGTVISTNTTYLVLWQADGLVASGSGSEMLTMWILTAPQFSYFKGSGLTNTSLNAAVLGVASNNVLERAALSGTYAATFLSNSFACLYATFKSSATPVNVTFDEIRVGTGSLDEVTPMATPSLPRITVPPASQVAIAGATAQLIVGASGYPALSYQWMAGTIGSGLYTNLLDGGNISGSSSATLTITNTAFSNEADYVVVVSNSIGSVTSSPPATLTVSSPIPPQITTEPLSQAVRGGVPTVQMSVVATGSSPLSYQWMAGSIGSGIYKPLAAGGNVSGASSSTLALTDVSLNNAADYVVVVSNTAGSVTSAPPATLTVYYTTNSVPAWGLGPFYRPVGIDPVISSNTSAVFTDPILGAPVNWEYTHTFNPGAVLMGSNVYVLYRAEDNSGTSIGTYCSRDGLASSPDGMHFVCNPTPSLHPDTDAQETNEWPGGCEDPRIVETEAGTYVVLYTQWNRSLARLGVATSTDLLNWTKYGSPFAKYGNSNVNANTATKSAGILTALENGQLKAVKHLGQYWMYWGEGAVQVATSDDCVNWRPMGPTVLTTRAGKFDSSLVEAGPPAVRTANGIVVFYNGKNASPGDINLNAGAYSSGQALFDAKEPTKLVGRMDTPFFQPEAPYEVTGQYAAGTTFIEGLVALQNQWFLYYGAADTFVGMATCTQSNFGVTEAWPTNCYYQGFDGFTVGTTNSCDGSILFSTALGSVATVQDSFQKELQLTANGAQNVTSAFVLPDIVAGRAIYGFSAKWDSEFYYTNVSGCGLSFNLSPLNNAQILGLPVEQGYGNGLSVAIDNDKQGTPGFFVRVNNSIVASQLFNPDVQWGKTNSLRNYFSVDWNYTNGLTLAVNGTVIFTNMPTPGFTPAPGQYFSWAARTSTNSEDARIDNVCVFANANLAPIQLAPPFLSSGNLAGFGASNAFDGNFGTQWQTAATAGCIQAACANGPQIVTAYSVVSASSNWQADPQSWTLQGSLDGTNWVTVDAEYLESWENNDALMRGVPRTFIVNQPGAYQMYQLNITTNNGAATTQLADLLLYTCRATLPQPVMKGLTMSHNSLIVNGIAGAPSGTYYVMLATNLTQAANQWYCSSTNQFDTAGGFAFTNALPTDAPALFVRLALP